MIMWSPNSIQLKNVLVANRLSLVSGSRVPAPLGGITTLICTPGPLGLLVGSVNPWRVLCLVLSFVFIFCSHLPSQNGMDIILESRWGSPNRGVMMGSYSSNSTVFNLTVHGMTEPGGQYLPKWTFPKGQAGAHPGGSGILVLPSCKFEQGMKGRRREEASPRLLAR